MRKGTGFTLIELLVVLAIITVLSALLFPVFKAARSSAKASACLSNFHAAQLGMTLYIADYDETLAPPNYGLIPNNSAANDRTWVQLLLPYIRSFGIFQCPGDFGIKTGKEGIFDRDLVPGDTYAKFYSASQRSNIGYNYIYMAPLVRNNDMTWSSYPVTFSGLADATRAVLFVDSVYGIDGNGRPYGGGSYLIMPPCRYSQKGKNRIDTYLQRNIPNGEFFEINSGWTRQNSPGGVQYGGAYPWHNERMNVVFAQGNVKRLTVDQLMAGCDPDAVTNGLIYDDSQYIWDTF